MSKVIEGYAYGLGVQAFKNGKKCIPCLDKEFYYNCIADCKVGESIPYTKAWIKGWTKENLRTE